VNISFFLCIILLVCVAVTGLAGYIQTKLDLHRFVLHKYFAYCTLCITVLHVAANWRKIRKQLQQFMKNFSDK